MKMGLINQIAGYAITFALVAVCCAKGRNSGGGVTPPQIDMVGVSGVVIEPANTYPMTNNNSATIPVTVRNYDSVSYSNVQYTLAYSSESTISLDTQRCTTMPANSSCTMNVKVPPLKNGQQGHVEIAASYANSKGVTWSNNQVVNFDVINVPAGTIYSNGNLDLPSVPGTMVYGTVYVIAGPASGNYNNVNLNLNGGSIVNGFENGQEIAPNQVVAVEVAYPVTSHEPVSNNITISYNNVSAQSEFPLKDVTSGAVTSLGLYKTNSQNVVHVQYLQPAITFRLSNNNGYFESTNLKIAVTNLAASGLSSVALNISKAYDWLGNSAVSASSPCSVSGALAVAGVNWGSLGSDLYI